MWTKLWWRGGRRDVFILGWLVDWSVCSVSETSKWIDLRMPHDLQHEPFTSSDPDIVMRECNFVKNIVKYFAVKTLRECLRKTQCGPADLALVVRAEWRCICYWMETIISIVVNLVATMENYKIDDTATHLSPHCCTWVRWFRKVTEVQKKIIGRDVCHVQKSCQLKITVIQVRG